MPDLAARFDQEEQLAAILAGLNQRARGKILAAAGTPPRLENIPAELWQQLEQEARDEIAAALIVIYLLSSDQMLDGSTGLPKVENATEIQRKAANFYAQRQAAGVAAGLIGNLRDGFGKILANPLGSRAQLAADSAKLSSVSMAEGEAITQTTAAITAGEQGAAETLRFENGVLLEPYFITARDSRVCPRCQPLDGLPAVELPPIHKRCRCYLEWRVAK